MAKRILVIVNKRWEFEPLLGILLNKKVRPKVIKKMNLLYHPNITHLQPKDFPHNYPRVELNIGDDKVELWCIRDLMNPGRSGSSTEEKVRILPNIFEYSKQAPDFVIAFGTAAFYNETSYNGCVVVGSKTFIYNPYTSEHPNPDPNVETNSNWDLEHIYSEKLYESISTEPLFNKYFTKSRKRELRHNIEARFLKSSFNSAEYPIIIFAYNQVALGVVNITNYDDYGWADHKALESLKKKKTKDPLGSMETTHGIIRICCSERSPFIFVSGIADRLGHFIMEATPRNYTQNFVAAHNAGVVTSWLLPEIIEFLNQ